jgi:hypothetical protein
MLISPGVYEVLEFLYTKFESRRHSKRGQCVEARITPLLFEYSSKR